MARVYFLKIEGIPGDSDDPRHHDELELLTFAWGESSAPPKKTLKNLTFTADMSRASPKLFLACATGELIKDAVLTVRDGDAGAGEVVRWKLSDIVVAEYRTHAGAAGPVDEVALRAESVEALPVPEEDRPEPSTAIFGISVVRPDDLLNLDIQAVNLRVDTTVAADPVLVVRDRAQPAQLIVTFPPQTIAETAYFESAIVPPDGPPGAPDETKRAQDPLDAPGVLGLRRASIAESAGPSRLAFDVPPDARLRFTIDGLLDWAGLRLRVNALAALPPEPTEDQIAAAPPIQPPAETETALELPYRLVISPNRDVAWRHRTLPFTSRGRTELWHTRLVLQSADGVFELSPDNRASMRAVWSPDYDSGHLPQPADKDPDLGLTAMSPYDRHQLVVLTSAFHGYEVDTDVSLPAFGGKGGRFGTQSGRIHLLLTGPYVPAPFEAEQLMLSPLGGWLRSRGHWTPPRELVAPPWLRQDVSEVFEHATVAGLSPRNLDVARTLAPESQGAFAVAPLAQERVALRRPGKREPEQLDLSEWVHVAAQGRDHYVRIVYEGELKPFGHRAALVKVTERKFVEHGGIVGAYLMQRMFVVVREPEKEFAAADRAMPFKRVRVTTVVTPDLAEPALISGSKRSFWVEVTTAPTTRERFAFHCLGTDIAGDRVDFTIPMLFVSASETTSTPSATLPLVLAAYNDSTSEAGVSLRDAHVPGQKVMFAEPDPDPAKRNTNTQLVTRALNFVVDPAEGGPKLLKADVKIPQVEELLGTEAPTTIRLLETYVEKGFDSKTGVFAEIAKLDVGKATKDNPFAGVAGDSLGVGFSADKAGGFATPNLGVSTLSRALGPLAGTVTEALDDTFHPASFFGGGLAKLFGSFDLADVLPLSTLGKNAPKLRTTTKDVPGGKVVLTTLDWKPEVESHDAVVVAFTAHSGKTKLVVNGQIKKSVTLDGVGEPPTFEFTGTLNDFEVSILKSITVKFVRFSFGARSHEKPDVSVTLDPVTPISFDGDLKFVEELRKAIPPDLFGDGPSLDISPSGIRAGFAIALPPLAVGVFALKDVNLGAALTLPFLEGKPILDFNVSERQHPFLLAVGIFGGGGFFHLQVDTAGIKEIEAALEFGATASIDIGVASGGVHMMAGIYFSLQRRDPGTDMAATLSGYLRVGGSLSVLGLITVSVEFNLSFTYDSKKEAAYGRATLTVKVEIAFFSKSVELTVERTFGGHGGDPKFVQLFTSGDTWSEYALAFA